MMPTHTLIQASEALTLAAQQPLLWLDARFELGQPQQGAADFAGGHVAGAHYIDLERHLSGPAGAAGRHPLPMAATLAAQLAQWGLGHTMPVLIYDQGAVMYAARAWAMLRWLGHTAVAVVDGGLPALQQAGAHMASGQTRLPETGNFRAATPLLRTVSAADIAQQLIAQALGQATAPLLVDARAAERFHGTPHPLDPRCGHIPGAVNRFFKLNLDAEQHFLPAAVLHPQWQGCLNGTPPPQVVHYCGSGVSACVNLLAMEYAGLHGSALYVGSWSEWAADADNPVANGAA